MIACVVDSTLTQLDFLLTQKLARGSKRVRAQSDATPHLCVFSLYYIRPNYGEIHMYIVFSVAQGDQLVSEYQQCFGGT